MQLNGFKYRKLSNIFIQSINEFLTDTNPPGQSGPGSNGNEGVLHIPKAPKLETHHLMQFSVLSRTLVGEI